MSSRTRRLRQWSGIPVKHNETLMSDDHEALHDKKREVEAMALAAANRITGAKAEDAWSTIGAFASFTPPEEPEAMMEMITMASFGR